MVCSESECVNLDGCRGLVLAISSQHIGQSPRDATQGSEPVVGLPICEQEYGLDGCLGAGTLCPLLCNTRQSLYKLASAILMLQVMLLGISNSRQGTFHYPCINASRCWYMIGGVRGDADSAPKIPKPSYLGRKTSTTHGHSLSSTWCRFGAILDLLHQAHEQPS